MSKNRSGAAVMSIAGAGVLLGLAYALSFIVIFRMPQGGSVTPCATLILAVIGYFFGPLYGFSAGVLYGVLQFISGGFFLHPAQVLLDYPLSFGAFGLAGLFWRKKDSLALGYIAGNLGRLFFNFLSGVIFFAEYTPAGDNTFIYSLTYNLGYNAPEAFIALVIISIPAVKSAIEQIKGRLGQA